MNICDYLDQDTFSYIFRYLDKLDLLMIPLVNHNMYGHIKKFEPSIYRIEYIISYLNSAKWPNLATDVLIQKIIGTGFRFSYDKIYIHSINRHFWKSIEGFILKHVNHLTIIRYGPINHVRSVTNHNMFDRLNKNYVRAALEAAVLSKDIRKLKMIHRIGNECGSLSELIASQGNLEMLQWVRTPKKFMGNHTCAWNANTCAAAVKGGHLEVLTWAIKNGCPYDFRVKIFAEKYGHPEIMYLVKDHVVGPIEPTMYAVQTNDLDLLKWSLDNSYVWNIEMCDYAIQHGFLELLQLVHKEGCIISEHICEKAVKYGHLGVLQWATQNNFKIDDLHKLFNILAENCLKRCTTDTSHSNINGSIYSNWRDLTKSYTEIFTWIIEKYVNKSEYENWLSEYFKNSEDIEPHMLVSMWYITHGGAWSKLWCYYVIFTYNIDVLEFVAKRRLRIPDDICTQIAWIDRNQISHRRAMELLKWAVSKGYKMTSDICKAAAIQKDYQMLMWSVDNGCPLKITDYMGSEIGWLYNLTIKKEFYKEEHTEFLKWLILHGFKWNKETKLIAFNAEMYELLVWTKQNNIKETSY